MKPFLYLSYYFSIDYNTRGTFDFNSFNFIINDYQTVTGGNQKYDGLMDGIKLK